MAALLKTVATFLVLFSIGATGHEEDICMLHATVTFPKLLECPLVANTTDGDVSGSGLEHQGNILLNVSWSINGFYDTCQSHRLNIEIDYSGVHNNTCSSSVANLFKVMESGDLFIASVRHEMLEFTFKCKVWDEATLEWSPTYTLQHLKVLQYGLYYDTSPRIREKTFQKPMRTEEATIGANKVLCTQGEVLTAQVRWTKANSSHDEHSIQDITESPMNELRSTCFECDCMIDLISRNSSLQSELNNASKGIGYVSFTVTGYYLPDAFDLLLTSLTCTGIPNWFLSILLVKNVSTATDGDYGVTIQSNDSRLNYMSNFTLKADYLRFKPYFHLDTSRNTTSRGAKQYLCSATLPVTSSLAWEGSDEGTKIKHLPPQGVYEVDELCQAYSSEESDILSFTKQNLTLSTKDGLVSQQIVTLIACQISFGTFRCAATSSDSGQKYYSPQITVGMPTATHATPSNQNDSSVVIYTAVGCGFLVLTTVLILLIIVAAYIHQWMRSKTDKPEGWVTYKKREENIYY